MILRSAHSASLGLARSAYARPTTRSVASMRLLRAPSESERLDVSAVALRVQAVTTAARQSPHLAPFETQPIAVLRHGVSEARTRTGCSACSPALRLAPYPYPGKVPRLTRLSCIDLLLRVRAVVRHAPCASQSSSTACRRL